MQDLRVIDIRATAAAAEVEATLNGVCETGFYLAQTFVSNLPDGVSMRALFKRRLKPFEGR